MLRKSYAILFSVILLLLCFGCQSPEETTEWTAASLRNENGLFVVPGAEPRASLEEMEKVLGYTLEPIDEIPAYSLAESRRYVPVDTDRESMEVDFYGGSAVPDLIFSLSETNGDADEFDGVSLAFREQEAAEVSERFLADAKKLWGEPTEIRNGEGTIAINGKREPTEVVEWHWRVDGDEYITVLGAATVTHNGEIIRFLLEWGTYRTVDYQ